MAPFDFNLFGGNANGQWDWWDIDAGDEDRFAVRPEHDGDPRLIFATHPNGEPRERQPLRCDGGPRGLLDFDATRAAAVSQARARWQAEQEDFARLVADHPPAEPLTTFLRRHRADTRGYPRGQAVVDHHAQPLVRALNHGSAWDRYPNLGLWVLGPDSDPISHFTRDPQTDLDEAAAWALASFALLTLDGQWIDAECPSACVDVVPGEDPRAAYARWAAAYLDDLDDDCVIVRLSCHG
ncbi:hypothetical protein ACFW1A_06595 [Kitasatospora sp. NPDC058965]|uniref:hypothetical protein n=1 Tax=Kitasatospora sp. NPDC058965 TaxID=3346682 RepID=UPI00368922B9